MSARFHPLLLLLSLIPAACTTVSSHSVFNKFEELEISRTFSSQTVGTQPWLIGVTSQETLQEMNTDAKSSGFTVAYNSEQLTHNFRAFRPDLPLAERATSDKLEKSFTKTVEKFAEREELPLEAYPLIEKMNPNPVWLLLASIEDSAADQRMQEEDIKDDKGHKIARKYSFISARNISIRYFIYDSKQRSLVFSGVVKSTTKAIQDRIHTESESSALWDAITGQNQNVSDQNFPEYPSLRQALNDNYQKFVQALPYAKGN